MLQQITEWQKLFSQTRNNIAEIFAERISFDYVIILVTLARKSDR